MAEDLGAGAGAGPARSSQVPLARLPGHPVAPRPGGIPGFTLLVGARRGRVPLGRLRARSGPRTASGRSAPRRCFGCSGRRSNAMIGPLRRIRVGRPKRLEVRRTTSSSSAAACTAWPPPMSWRSAASRTSRCWRRSTSGRAPVDAQHGDHPLQLPHGAGRRLLRRVGEALRAAVGGSRLQRPVQPARPPDARPHGARDRRPARARRDEPAAWASTRRSSSPRRSGKLAPALDVSKKPRFPIHAALWHPPGGIIRHDAVVWGYARGAEQLGRRDPPVHRGDRHRRRRRPRDAACRHRAGRSAPGSSSTRRPAGRPRSRRWSACGSRS